MIDLAQAYIAYRQHDHDADEDRQAIEKDKRLNEAQQWVDTFPEEVDETAG